MHRIYLTYLMTPEIHCTNVADYIDHLAYKRKIKMLGEGAYGIVFQHPSYKEIAVKIVRDDVAYKMYVDLCTNNPNNRYLPKILYKKTLKFAEDETSLLVFMEKLSHMSRKKQKVQYVKTITDLTIRAIDKSRLLQYESFHQLSTGDWVLLSKQRKDIQLGQFSKFMIKAISNGYCPDLHEDNIMLRGQGEMVFTDPIA